MPYIKQGNGMRLEPGPLTFRLQQVVKNHLDAMTGYHPFCYQDIAEVLGCIEGLKADFIRRKVNPYEAKKQKGKDVW